MENIQNYQKAQLAYQQKIIEKDIEINNYPDSTAQDLRFLLSVIFKKLGITSIEIDEVEFMNHLLLEPWGNKTIAWGPKYDDPTKRVILVYNKKDVE